MMIAYKNTILNLNLFSNMIDVYYGINGLDLFSKIKVLKEIYK